jgi:hypothetical protein
MDTYKRTENNDFIICVFHQDDQIMDNTEYNKKR